MMDWANHRSPATKIACTLHTKNSGQRHMPPGSPTAYLRGGPGPRGVIFCLKRLTVGTSGHQCFATFARYAQHCAKYDPKQLIPCYAAIKLVDASCKSANVNYRWPQTQAEPHGMLTAQLSKDDKELIAFGDTGLGLGTTPMYDEAPIPAPTPWQLERAKRTRQMGHCEMLYKGINNTGEVFPTNRTVTHKAAPAITAGPALGDEADRTLKGGTDNAPSPKPYIKPHRYFTNTADTTKRNKPNATAQPGAKRPKQPQQPKLSNAIKDHGQEVHFPSKQDGK